MMGESVVTPVLVTNGRSCRIKDDFDVVVLLSVVVVVVAGRCMDASLVRRLAIISLMMSWDDWRRLLSRLGGRGAS